ncbi:MAG: RsmD family RNA methyltransferase, partial [Actinobacteria bacterium]|nr:RsmD family RNA methyltransferase [Actinomycetota bacterium]
DPDRAARAAIGANLVTTGFDGPATRIVASSAQQYLRSCGDATCGLAFADPPYAFDDWPGLFADLDPVMAHDGVIVVESDRSIVGSPGWNVTRSRRYGSTVVEIHVRAAAPPSLHGVNQ